MNWSSIDNIRLTYRLMRVKGYGPVQVNKFLFAHQPYIQTTEELDDYIRHTLTPGECNEYMAELPSFHNKHFRIQYMSILDSSYPQELKVYLAGKAPSVLSYIGNVELFHKRKIAFSGSRKVSEKGIWITQDSIRQLSADKDICIVSGYAAGVDMTAHYEALANDGSTIIVLPEGINNFAIKKELQQVWDWNRVLVISEFLPNEQWLQGRAMQRNQTIVGLSDAVVVVEAGVKGGSLDTGIKALNEEKALFVPLYAAAPESAKGNSWLLRQGAKPLTWNKNTNRVNLSVMKTMNTLQPARTLFG